MFHLEKCMRMCARLCVYVRVCVHLGLSADVWLICSHLGASLFQYLTGLLVYLYIYFLYVCIFLKFSEKIDLIFICTLLRNFVSILYFLLLFSAKKKRKKKIESIM